jgi:hypothetical protein
MEIYICAIHNGNSFSSGYYNGIGFQIEFSHKEEADIQKYERPECRGITFIISHAGFVTRESF